MAYLSPTAPNRHRGALIPTPPIIYSLLLSPLYREEVEKVDKAKIRREETGTLKLLQLLLHLLMPRPRWRRSERLRSLPRARAGVIRECLRTRQKASRGDKNRHQGKRP